MAITYGSIEGRLSVGIDVTMSPATVTKDTASVTLTWKVYARSDSYGFNDPQTMTLSNAISATKNYTMVSGTGDDVVLLVGTWTQTVSLSYSATVTKTLVAAASGLFNGGTPSHSRAFVVPKRPPQIPDAPLSAGVALASASSALVDWDRPSNYNSASDIWTNVIVSRSVNGGAYSTVATLAGSATSWTDTGLLTNTTYAYRVASKNVSGTSTAVDAGSVQTALVVPTAVTPASGASVVVPNPTLGGTMAAIAGGILQKMQWEIASDSAFTTNVRSITEPDADLKASGATTETPTVVNLALANGTWWIRGRVITATGGIGPYSTATSFTVTVPALTAPTTVTPAASSTVTTIYPTFGATIVADGSGRLKKAEWQIATDSGFTAGVRNLVEPDSDFRVSGATTEIMVNDPLGAATGSSTWYVRARSVGNDGSVSGWTAGQSFTVTKAAPPTPTGITPATGGSNVLTNTPTLGGILGVATEGRLQKLEWRLATDAGMSANLRTVTSADLTASGSVSALVPFANKLSQTTWYIQARAVDEYGHAGSYSAAHSFVVSHPPLAVPQSPINDQMYQYGATNTFSWLFTDTSPLDVQTAYQIVVENNATGAVVLDTGKVASSSLSGNHAIPAGSKDVKLRWKIKLWDTDDVAGNYSSYQLFTVSDPPVVTITSPTAGGSLTTGQPTITWTNDGSTVQASRRVVITRVLDGVVVADSGLANTSVLSYTTPTVVLENTLSYTVSVTVTDQYGMTSTTTHTFTTTYQAPDVVFFSVDETQVDTAGPVLIDWSQSAPDSFFVDWRLYRRQVESLEWEILQVITNPAITYWHDWTALSNTVYEYAVTQRAGRSGIVLESPKATTQSVVVEGGHYWLINPNDETDNVRLSHVTGDSFTDEYEEASMVIIGRGRKVNHGTRLGYAGTLTVQLRDDDFGTARSKRVHLQMLKDARTSYYMRTPFGDLFEVSLGNLGFGRVAGVGTSEYLDVTIPYAEVF
jgi:hypothetical protein